MTELEGAVLGVIWSRGPITAYGVRQRFSRSTTHGWSSSSGAIYPAIRRLTAQGLIESIADAGDRRATRQLTVTEKGRSHLRSWLRDLQDWMGGATVDPIRTRINYIGALPKAQQLALVDRAEANAVAALKEVDNLPLDPQAHERFGLEASYSGIRGEIEARLSWLREVRGLIESQ